MKVTSIPGKIVGVRYLKIFIINKKKVIRSKKTRSYNMTRLEEVISHCGCNETVNLKVELSLVAGGNFDWINLLTTNPTTCNRCLCKLANTILVTINIVNLIHI